MEIIKQTKKKVVRESSITALKDKELRVVAYARVSTDHDDQNYSINSQQKYYKEKIEANPNWQLINIYVDEGISGTKTIRRESFRRMIKDGINGKYDLILTKSISRFARNTVDALQYVRLLKDKGIGIIFQEENINTLDMNSELILTILSSIAQQEAQNLSNHVQLGLQMKAKNGGMIGSTFCYGYNYNKETKNLEINEETSKVVKKIFELYIEGNGTLKIAKYLTEQGIPTSKGNKIWNEGTITHILRNERYIGDLLLGKHYSVDPVTKRAKINTGERDRYYIRNHHPAIIDKDTWDKVQEVMKKRAEERKGKSKDRVFNTRYVFSSKFICGYCGTTMKRFKQSTCRNAKYYCDKNLSGYSSECPNSKMIDEEIVKKAFMQMVIKLRKKIKNDSKYSEVLQKRLKHSRGLLLNRDDLDSSKFDKELFDMLIKYAIVGDENKPFTIRFILNAEDDLIFRTEEKKESKNLYKILEFDSNQIFYYMETLKNGKTKQVFVSRFKVTCEIDYGE